MNLTFRATALALLILALPAPIAGQQLIGVADMPSFDWTEPSETIWYGSGQHQFGYLRLPPGDGPHPVFVFIHGGCWLSQFDIRYVGMLEQAVADAGYAVWSLEYRRVGDEGGGWPGTFLDIASGIDHLRELAGDFELDLDRVIASGHSAGGQLALWAAARERIDSDSPLHPTAPLAIHGVLALAPAADLEGLHAEGTCGNVVDRLMGGSPAEFPERYSAGSPMQLQPVDVPQRIVVGAMDQMFGSFGRSHHAAAEAGGLSEVTLTVAEESGHFEMVVPSTSSWPLVMDELRQLSEAIDRRATASGGANQVAARSNPHDGDPGALRAGRVLFGNRCSRCHGPDGRGDSGPDLTTLWVDGADDGQVFQVVREGIPGSIMPATDGLDNEIWAVVAYVKSLGAVEAYDRLVGDPARGRAIFADRCVGCHTVQGEGGRLGPELTRITRLRSRELLERSIRDPDADVSRGYRPVTLVTASGEQVRGVTKGEDAFSIQVMDVRQRLQGYRKADLSEVVRGDGSLMPAFGVDRVDAIAMEDLVSYLVSLTEVPADAR